MTIDPARTVFVGTAVLLTWFVAMIVAAWFEPTDSVLVIAPRDLAVRAAVAAGLPVVSPGHVATLVRADRKGTTRSLYAAGAWLVLPAPPAGCFGTQ